MQIIPALTAHARVPHMFETPDDMIINGQIYDKATMKPKPYHFANITDFLPECNIFDECINRIGDKNCIPDKGIDYKNIIQDTEDSSIFYVLYFVPGDTVTLRLSKIKKHDNTYTIWNTTTYGSPHGNYNRANMYKFLGQTKDYILLSEAHWAHDSWSDLRNIIVRRVSKKDLSSTYVIDYANNADPYSNWNSESACFACSHYLIKNDDSYAYFYIQYGAAAFIRKYNILNNTWANLYTFPAEYLQNYNIGVSNIIEFNNKYYIITGNAAHTSYELQEISIGATDGVSIKHYNISHAGFPYNARGYRTYEGTSHALTPYLVYTLKNIDNKYIGLTVHHNEGFGIGSNNKHILIKKTSSGFSITHARSIPSCYGVLYYNPYIAVVLTTEGYTFYKVNTSTDTWDEIRRETGTFNYIAFDSYKRFYTVDTSNRVKMYSNVSTYEIDVHFENNSYSYQGTNIQTRCIITAQNFLDEYISTTLKVTLTGPVRFADGSIEKEVDTKYGTVYEDVYIHDSGQIGVHAIEVEGWS